MDVQGRDSALARIEHRRARLPELNRIAELEEQARNWESQRVAAQTRVSDLAEDQRAAEHEVDQVRARRDRNNDRMNSGAVTNPKDLEGLEHELTALDRRIGTLEDEQLEVMDKLESAETQLAQTADKLAEVSSELAAERGSRDEQFAEFDAEANAEREERQRLIADIPDDLLALYDRLRGQHGGVGAALLRAKQCEGCRLEINGADLREIATSAPDDVTRCPECSRILVRTNESGL